jgi:transcriptional regulator with XRE-family HTH domain
MPPRVNAGEAAPSGGATPSGEAAPTDGATPPREAAPAEVVAANLRRLRAARGLSTAELARRSGVARATLAQLEAGRGNPTLETLYALANTLGTGLGDVIAPPAAPDVDVVRAGEGPRVSGRAVRARLVTRLSATALDVYELSLAPGRRQRSEPHPPGVVEHLLLHTGRARIGPEASPVELGPGDYARYSGSVPHLYEALEPGVSATLVMESPT